MTILEGLIAGTEARDRRQALALQKKELDAKLMSQGYNPNDLSIVPGGQEDNNQKQQQIMAESLKAMQGKLAAQDSDKALVDFASTGDATYLQNGINNNPVLKKAWGDKGVQAVSNIDFTNDTKLLAQRGFQPSEYDTQEKQDILKKNIYKTYDGKDWNIGLLNKAVQETGAATRLGDRQSQVFHDNHQEFRDFMAGPRSSANTAEGHKYEEEIMQSATDNKLPPNLIAAMMNKESLGDPNAVSPKGADRGFGLMQVSKIAAKDVGMEGADLADPKTNIMVGGMVMAKMLERYNGDTRLALAAYNAGPTAVDKYNGIPPFDETQKYVDKITKNFAAGESYYNAGQDPVKNASSDNQPYVKDTNPKEGIDRANKYADNRIATIQSYFQGNANAAKGSSNALEQQKADAETVKSQSELIAATGKDNSTSDQKNIKASRDETTSLVNKFGGEDKFLSTNFDTQTEDGSKNFNKAWSNVVAIQKYEGTTLSDQDKKNIIDVRGLITLGQSAKDLSADKTGLIDKQLSNLKLYMSDNVKGTAARSAYMAFSNALLHAFGGSNMTPAEIERFTSAYGSLGEKQGPVLEQFKTALLQVKSKLDTVSGLSNPYTSKVLLGADQERVSKIITSIDSTINVLQGGTAPEIKHKKALGDYFGGK